MGASNGGKKTAIAIVAFIITLVALIAISYFEGWTVIQQLFHSNELGDFIGSNPALGISLTAIAFIIAGYYLYKTRE